MPLAGDELVTPAHPEARVTIDTTGRTSIRPEPRVATLLLARHAHTAAVGSWLAGRAPRTSLSDEGREQARHLADSLRDLSIGALYTSPRLRARQTASAIEAALGLPVRVSRPFDELDYGDWTGRTLESLRGDAAWTRFNAERERACPPGGEPLASMRVRVWEGVLRLARRHEGAIALLVTHAEPMRAALSAATGRSLDEVLAFDPAPASIWVVRIAGLRG